MRSMMFFRSETLLWWIFLATVGQRVSSEYDDHPLYSIFKKSGTDKVTKHNYDVYYERYLKDFRHQEGFRMMEIGANTGESLLAWADYFERPEAIHAIAFGNGNGIRNKIFSIDHKDMVCKQDPVKCKVVEVMNGDQSDKQFLQETVIRHGANFGTESPPQELDSAMWRTAGYDFILDDGSHVPFHMVLSFMELWPSVRPGGIYIIEDLETNYWNKMKPTRVTGYVVRGTGLGQPFQKTGGNAVEKFKQLADLLNRPSWGSCKQLKDFSVFGRAIDWSVSSVTFGNNHLVVRKKTHYESIRIPQAILNKGCSVDEDKAMRVSRKWLSQNPDKSVRG